MRSTRNRIKLHLDGNRKHAIVNMSGKGLHFEVQLYNGGKIRTRGLKPCNNTLGQLCTGDTQDRFEWNNIAYIRNAISVDAGLYHGAYLDQEYNVFLWGSNNLQQLGNVNDTYTTKPIKLVINGNIDKFYAVKTGCHFTVAIDVNWNIWFTGFNSKVKTYPRQILKNFKEIKDIKISNYTIYISFVDNDTKEINVADIIF